MNGLKKFFVSIACILLFFCIMAFVASFAIKDIVQNGLIVTAVKEAVTENAPENQREELEKLVDKISEYPETNQIIESILDDYANYKTNKETSDRTIDLITEFCFNHKEEMAKLLDEEINFDLIESEAKEDFKNELKEGYTELLHNTTGKDAETISEVITVYKDISSSKQRYMLAGAIIFLIGLIVLLEWSSYKWLKPVGTTLITTAVFTLITEGILSTLSSMIVDQIKSNISISSSILIVVAIIELLLGILSKVLYKKLQNKEMEEREFATDIINQEN